MNSRCVAPLIALALAGCNGADHPSTDDSGGGGAAASTSTGQSSANGGNGGSGEGGSGPSGSGGSAKPVVTTLSALDANDTSASSLFVDSYTPATRFNGSKAPVSNGDATPGSTTATTLAAGRVSKVDIHTLVGSLPVFVETQSWFCTNGKSPLGTDATSDQCGSHIDIGYDSSSADQVKKQVADMRSRGIDGALIDWQGQKATTNNDAIGHFKEEAEASNGKFQFAVIEDEGIKACAAASGCDVSQALVDDIDYLATNLFDSPAYLHQNGRPVLFFFSIDTWVKNDGKTIDWSFVRAHVAKNPLFVFENAGGFTHAVSDGAYAWLHDTDIGAYPGSDPFGVAGFLPYFYQQDALHESLMSWGSAYKGFDDQVVNGWGGGRRYAGQQCGKTLLDTFAAAKAQAAHLDGVQIATWDDYEEGSETETGIDNHLAMTGAFANGVVTFALAAASDAPKDCTDAIAAGLDLGDTVDRFEVYAKQGDKDELTLVSADVAANARTVNVGDALPAGTTELFVYAVGKPMIHNHLSTAIAVSAP
jgi:hypothetical protein